MKNNRHGLCVITHAHFIFFCLSCEFGDLAIFWIRKTYPWLVLEPSDRL